MPMPEADPSPALVEQALARIEGRPRELLQGRIKELEEPQRRAVLWLIAAEGVALSEYRLDQTRGLRMLAFGAERGLYLRRYHRPVHRFIGLRHLYGHEEDETLRVTVFLDPGCDYDGPRELLLEDEDGRPEQILVRPEEWRFIPHSAVNLVNATLCCWVIPDSGGHGLLTADHAVEQGYSILEDGTMVPVLWRAPGGLDAAVLDAQAAGSLAALPATLPLQGDVVEVIVKGHAQHREVTDVSPTYGTNTSAIPHRFLLDRPLQAGDSGSLERHHGAGAALGIYLGRLGAAEGPRGLCQGLVQLDELFRFEGRCEGFYEE